MSTLGFTNWNVLLGIVISLSALPKDVAIAQNTSNIKLEELRSGGRLKYQSLQWKIQNYGTYKDPQGYQTQEWLLLSPTNEKRYLQKEYNPATPKNPTHWYFSEEIDSPQVLEPKNSTNIIPGVWQNIQDGKTPQPELHALNRSYLFDFQTKGTYSDQDGTLPRITWDYWDKAHKWNLELEAFPEKELHVYSAQEVNPEAFIALASARTFPIGQAILATSMIICGITIRRRRNRTGNL